MVMGKWDPASTAHLLAQLMNLALHAGIRVPQSKAWRCCADGVHETSAQMGAV